MPLTDRERDQESMMKRETEARRERQKARHRRKERDGDRGTQLD